MHDGDPSEFTIEEQGLLLLGPGPEAEMPFWYSSPNHYGTFIVSLPSLHQGGNMVLGKWKPRVHELIDHTDIVDNTSSLSTNHGISTMTG